MSETAAKQAPAQTLRSGQSPTALSGPAVEEVKNCPACKKPLKRARRYYRNGAYYCNANCFKKANAAAPASPQDAPTPPKAGQAGSKSSGTEQPKG